MSKPENQFIDLHLSAEHAATLRYTLGQMDWAQLIDERALPCANEMEAHALRSAISALLAPLQNCTFRVTNGVTTLGLSEADLAAGPYDYPNLGNLVEESNAGLLAFLGSPGPTDAQRDDYDPMGIPVGDAHDDQRLQARDILLSRGYQFSADELNEFNIDLPNTPTD